jgi:hypothetical protein
MKTHNKTVNERQQAGWTALSAASQQSCPLPWRYGAFGYLRKPKFSEPKSFYFKWS